jgi:hypothetical protein
MLLHHIVYNNNVILMKEWSLAECSMDCVVSSASLQVASNDKIYTTKKNREFFGHTAGQTVTANEWQLVRIAMCATIRIHIEILFAAMSVGIISHK